MTGLVLVVSDGERELVLVDRTYHLVPAFDGSDDPVWVSGPLEGLWVGVLLGDKAVDGGLQINGRMEGATLEAPLGELGKEAFDGVEP